MGELLRCDALTKRYGGVPVLRDVDLALRAGEARALLGENGAGKSTLIKILSGVVHADGGQVLIDGEAVTLGSPRQAVSLGIATVHQELAIVPGLSVAENVLLGHPTPTVAGAVRWKALERRAADLLGGLGQDLDVRVDAGRLRPVAATMVAIARAMSHEARVLVLDEPTASLTDQETSQLFAALGRVRAAGVAVLYVSHRLEEVQEVCETATVLRNGEVVLEGRLADTTVGELITAMAGRPVDAVFPPRPDAAPGDVLLSVDSLSGRTVRDLTFAVRSGEVLGIAGLAGSGRSEVLRLLAGVQRPSRGRVAVGRDGHAPRSVRHGHRLGLALVPQERRADALVPDTVERNANLATIDRHARRGVVMSRGRARRHAEELVEGLRVRHRSLDQQVLHLSGGNQQKVVLARFLALDPDVLLLDEPTRGVDVGTKSEIYHLVRARTAAGAAAVVVSSELPELIGLCDRILVLREGVPMGEFPAATTTEDELLHACYGRTT